MIDLSSKEVIYILQKQRKLNKKGKICCLQYTEYLQRKINNENNGFKKSKLNLNDPINEHIYGSNKKLKINKNKKLKTNKK